jgi:hypothetical protein
MMAKKVTAAEAGLFQLKKQTERLINEAQERIARFRKVEETATTDAQRKQAQREQQRDRQYDGKAARGNRRAYRRVQEKIDHTAC